MENSIRRICAITALVVLVSSAALAQSFAAPPADAWPKSGGNLFNQNYSPLTQINRQNVAGLKVVSRARLDGTEEPFVVGYDGRAYLKGLEATNTVVVGESEEECRASFPFTPK